MNENFKTIVNEKQPQSGSFLYRYVTIDKLLDFLLSGRIPLVRLDYFDDKLEGAQTNHLMWNHISNTASDHFGPIADLIKVIAVGASSKNKQSLHEQKMAFQVTNYASCWYVNEYESVAMWNLYSFRDSVAIRIPYKTIAQLFSGNQFTLSNNSVTQIKYGSVAYHRFSNSEDVASMFSKKPMRGFMKDKSFEHEQEFRIMVETSAAIKTELHLPVIYLQLNNFTSLPFEIIFHPRALYWHRENLSKIMEKFDLKFKTSNSSLRDIFK